MLRANELRIGNYVYVRQSNTPRQISIINHSGFLNVFLDNPTPEYTSSISLSYKELRPIPLTEEWLLKFGFEKTSSGDFELDEYDFRIYFQKDIRFQLYSGGNWITISYNNFKYVNQLQNLFFIITGEELKIKE